MISPHSEAFQAVVWHLLVSHPALKASQTAADRESMATVKEVIYFGDMTYYDVKLDGVSSPVRLSMRNVPGRPVLDIGARARVAWSPDALVLFR